MDDYYTRSLWEAFAETFKMTREERLKYIGTDYMGDIFEKFTIKEFVNLVNRAKISMKTDVTIGDEIYLDRDHIRSMIITDIYFDAAGRLCATGAIGVFYNYEVARLETFEKTGRHFDAIPLNYDGERKTINAKLDPRES